MNLADLKKLKPSVTPGEAAAILEVSRQRVAELLDEGKLEAFPFYGSRRVVLSSVIQRLEKRCKIRKKASEILQ